VTNYNPTLRNLPTDFVDGVTSGLLYYNATTQKITLSTQDQISAVIFEAANGTYWDDYQLNLTMGKQGANAKPDYDYTNLGYLFPKNDATEILSLVGQMPHKWKFGSRIFPHVHWTQNASTNPVFKAAYKIYANNSSVPANYTVYEMSTQVFTYTSGNFAQISTNTTGIDLSSLILTGVSTILKFKFYREDNAYTGDCLVDHFDIHHEIDSFGSRGEYIK
jgi:hypothetical protein